MDRWRRHKVPDQPLAFHRSSSSSPEPSLGDDQYIRNLSANNANLFAGKFRDIHIDRSTNLNEVLKSLPTAEDASFNTYQRQHEPTCLPDTRIELLHDIYEWADDEDSPGIFWLSGLAGTGKSTVARTLVSKYSKTDSVIAVSFFFSRDGGKDGHLRYAKKFVTSIAVQLANSAKSLKGPICDAIMAHSDIANLPLRKQWRHLVLDPLSVPTVASCTLRCILVIDALDECEEKENVQLLLQLLAEAQSTVAVQFKVFLTSRPEVLIRNSFSCMQHAEHQDFVLHNISSSTVDHDICIFLWHELGRISREHGLGAGWPGDKLVDQLVRSANGLFIWAATACRFIAEGRAFALARIRTILKIGSSYEAADGISSDSSATDNDRDFAWVPQQHLDSLYTTVLLDSIRKYKDHERQQWREVLATTMTTIAVLLSPLSIPSLGKLLNTAQVTVDQTLSDLHAILDIPVDRTRPLRLHHPSFRDFLLDNVRCKDLRFKVREKQVHKDLAGKCIALMSGILKQDVLGTEQSGKLAVDVQTSEVEQHLTPEAQYACLYWVQHLQRSEVQLKDDEQVLCFLQKHLLHWLEALGWMRKVSEGVHAVVSLESMLTSCEHSQVLSEIVHDTKRFVLHSRSAIEQCPSQVYCSALLFAPSTSVVKRQFQDVVPRYFKRLPRVDNEWSASLQTLESHIRLVNAVVFSPDNKILASASNDGTVKLWDATAGTLLRTIDGHSSWVKDVAFSPVDKLLASASEDKTVRLWNLEKEKPEHILEGHADEVNAVAFSPVDGTLASASGDNTVKLWNATEGTLLCTLVGHSSSVNAVAFSPVDKLLASASEDKTVRLWNPEKEKPEHILEGHADEVNAVAFSPDGKLIASASDDKTVRVWMVETQGIFRILEGHSAMVKAVIFSRNVDVLVSASHDKKILLWSISKGEIVRTLEGHSKAIKAVAFSPVDQMLASSSEDMTVRLWDVSTTVSRQQFVSNPSRVSNVNSLHDKVSLRSRSNKTVRSWDTRLRPWLQAVEKSLKKFKDVAFSPDSRVIAVTLLDNTIELRDAHTGTLVYSLEESSIGARAVVFSPDSRVIAVTLFNGTVELRDTYTGTLVYSLEESSSGARAVVFSPDSRVIAVTLFDSTIELRDTCTGALLCRFKDWSRSFRTVIFSPDSKVIAATVDGNIDRTAGLWNAHKFAMPHDSNMYPGRSRNSVPYTERLLRIFKKSSTRDSRVVTVTLFNVVELRDAHTGTLVYSLEESSSRAREVVFSPDSRVIAVTLFNGTVELRDTYTGTLVYSLEESSSGAREVVFSPDSRVIAVTLFNDTVELRDAHTGTLVCFLEESSSRARAVVFSPDSRVIAVTLFDSTIELRDAYTGVLFCRFKDSSRSFRTVVFSPNSKLLAVTLNHNEVELWDTDPDAIPQPFEGHSLRVNAAAISPDGKVLATASYDNSVKIWDIGTQQVVQHLTTYTDRVRILAFSPDSLSLALALDRKVELWDSVGSCMQQAFEMNNIIRSLSFTEGCLKTDVETIHTVLDTDASDQYPPSNISVEEQWIRRGEQAVWLPPEYRPSCSAVWGNLVAIGHASGRISIIEFASL